MTDLAGALAVETLIAEFMRHAAGCDSLVWCSEHQAEEETGRPCDCGFDKAVAALRLRAPRIEALEAEKEELKALLGNDAPMPLILGLQERIEALQEENIDCAAAIARLLIERQTWRSRAEAAAAQLQAQRDRVQAVIAEMTDALSNGAFFNPEMFGSMLKQSDNPIFRWRNRLAETAADAGKET